MTEDHRRAPRAAPQPPDEADRLRALLGYGVLDTPPEPDFDDLVGLAARICGAPMASVTLVDSDRQWFKARIGMEATQTCRDVAFCSHTILGEGLFVVPDATADRRFQNNPFVLGEPHIRFYAGMPLTDPGGHKLGSLCVIDRVPRALSVAQRDALRVLGRQVVAQIVLRGQVQALKAAEAERRESDERFRAFMDHCPAVAYMKDAHGRFVYVNETLRRRFDVTGDAWIGRTDHDLFAPAFADLFRSHDLSVWRGAEGVVVDEQTPGAGGELVHWRSYKFPFVDGTGRRLLAGMSLDVTAERRAEDALRRSEAKFRSTVERLHEGVLLADAGSGRFVEANAALLSMLGYTLAEFLALDPCDIDAGHGPETFTREVRERLAADGRCDLGRREFRRKDGRALTADVGASLVPDGGAGLHAFIVRDMTEQRAFEVRLLRYQAELEEANVRLQGLASTDGLTGARNRAAFDERLGEEFARAKRHGRPLSVVLLDVDSFKRFNDTFGHPAGDEVLKAVAGLLRGAARTTDFVARYGGEEFAVVLPDTDLSGAITLAERSRRAVAGASWPLRPVTVSVGVASLGAETVGPEFLIGEADAALYRSKDGGRNRVSHGAREAAR